MHRPRSRGQKRFLWAFAVAITLALGFTSLSAWQRTVKARAELDKALATETGALNSLAVLEKKSQEYEALVRRRSRNAVQLSAAVDSFSREELNEPLKRAVEHTQLSQAFLRTASTGFGQEFWVSVPEEGHRLRIDLSASEDLQQYLESLPENQDELDQRFEFELDAGRVYHVAFEAAADLEADSTEISLKLDGKALLECTTLLSVFSYGEYGGITGSEFPLPRLKVNGELLPAITDGLWCEVSRYSCTFPPTDEEVRELKLEISLLSDKAIYCDWDNNYRLELEGIDHSYVDDDSVYQGMYLLKGLKPKLQSNSE
ncbi:MAG: hypothetical protein AAF394_07595 [Planctomycetota bacterium]